MSWQLVVKKNKYTNTVKMYVCNNSFLLPAYEHGTYKKRNFKDLGLYFCLFHVIAKTADFVETCIGRNNW